MNRSKTTINFPKIYICKYGLFFESQKLSQYCENSGHFYYVRDVILEKFIIHYYNYLPRLYFRYIEVNTCKKFTMPVEQLGVYFRRCIHL